MEKNKAKIIMLYIVMAALILFVLPALAQPVDKVSNPVDLLTWPEAAQFAAREMRGKYGKPDIESEELIIWLDKRSWKKITITKTETLHSFPLEHTDVLEQTIKYRVPVEKFDDLALFDGSIVIDRTQGTLSARCDSEAGNILILNLAHDIVIGKKTVEQAREFYADVIREKMLGGTPDYMQQLTFTQEKITSDPDINTTGLTKDMLINFSGKLSKN